MFYIRVDSENSGWYHVRVKCLCHVFLLPSVAWGRGSQLCSRLYVQGAGDEGSDAGSEGSVDLAVAALSDLCGALFEFI